MSPYVTQFGSLKSYRKGRVEPISDRVENYAFSNVFEICSSSKPYERVVFGVNQIYVLEAVRAEGTSAWFAAAHDEFALCMEGRVRVELIKPKVAPVAEDQLGAVCLGAAPEGAQMGWIQLGRGHQALLPAGSAYRFNSAEPAVLVLQSCKGEVSIERWEQICQRSNPDARKEGGGA